MLESRLSVMVQVFCPPTAAATGPGAGATAAGATGSRRRPNAARPAGTPRRIATVWHVKPGAEYTPGSSRLRLTVRAQLGGEHRIHAYPHQGAGFAMRGLQHLAPAVY